MYLSPLSPLLDEMLQNRQNDAISYLHTAEASALKKVFLDKIAKSLIHKERTLIVIPDAMSATVPAKLLSQHKLAHYTLHLTGKEKVSAQQIERLKRLYQLQKVQLESASYKAISQKYNHLHKKVSEALDSINLPSDKGPNLKSMILDKVDKPHNYIAPRIQRLQAALSIDHEHLAYIHRMQQCHQRHYDFMDAAGILSAKAFQDHDHLAKAQEEIKDLQKALSEAKIQIDLHLEAARTEFKNKIEEESALLLRVREELKLAIFEHEVGEMSQSFEEVYQDAVAPIQQLQFLKLHFRRQQTLNWGEAPLLIEAINLLTASLETRIDEVYTNFIKRLTPFNIELPALSDQLERIQSILRAISNSQFLNLKTPKRYLQVADMIEHINDAEGSLRLADACLMDAGYCRYRELAGKALLTDELRLSLTGLQESNWSDVIKYHASQKQIKGLLSDHINGLPEWLDELRKTAQQLRKINLQEIHNRWCKIREHSIAQIKNEYWETYQSIWNNADADITTLQLYKELGSRLLAFCPIAVTHESEAKKVLSADRTSFDKVIFLEVKELEDKLLKSFNNKKREISIISSYNIDIKDISSKIRKRYSSDMTLPNKPIKSYTRSTEKYRQALSIAGHLVDLVESSSIFKWKGQVVVSIVNHKLNDKILEHLDVKPQQFLYRSTVEIGHIVEALMTNSRVVLIGENQLINDQRTNDILWQQHLLNELKKVDIHLLSVSTLDLYKNKHKALEQLRLKLDRRVESEEETAIIEKPALELA